MHFRPFLQVTLLLGAVMFAGQSAVAEGPAADKFKYSDKWRIKCDEGADNDGFARFRITPKGGAPIEVTVNIKKGTAENDVAKELRDVLKAVLDKKLYHVERDDWEDVLIKMKWNGTEFSVQLVESTLKGTHSKVVLD